MSNSVTVIVLCDVQRTHAHTLKEREAEKESTRDQESGSREQKKERWKERDLHVTRAIPILSDSLLCLLTDN